ncbi:MAG: UDP-2,3-diacylglucosamine diphosphatase [Burkholderiaceae bacterium]
MSDLHLSAQTPASFDALKRHLGNTPADAVFILGDLFEAWVGDDARRAGFEAECTDMLREAARCRPIAFMHGNRDFLIGAEWLSECGMALLTDPTLLNAFGQRVLLTHGDILCVDDLDYQRYRGEVRSPAWQAAFLARPLAQRRLAAAQMREQSRLHQAQLAPSAWFDVDPAAAAQWLLAASAPTLVHGHTHHPGEHALGSSLMRQVLSDWDFDTPGRPRGDVLRLSAHGLTRSAPAGAAR